jgi:hypothetical protein
MIPRGYYLDQLTQQPGLGGGIGDLAGGGLGEGGQGHGVVMITGGRHHRSQLAQYQGLGITVGDLVGKLHRQS